MTGSLDLRRGLETPARRWTFVLAVAAWAIGTALAVGLLWRYKLTPGAEVAPRATWPTDSRLTRAADRPTLIMFAHPGCPCTRASLTELRDVAARTRGQVATRVVAVDAGEVAELRAAVVALPDVGFEVDPDGVEAARFGATTSGHVVLYGADGTLRFSGGITTARGHVGGGPAKDRLLAAITALAPRPIPTRVSAVFGCPLREEAP